MCVNHKKKNRKIARFKAKPKAKRTSKGVFEEVIEIISRYFSFFASSVLFGIIIAVM